MPKSRIAMFIDFDNAQLTAMEMSLENCRSSQLWVAPLVAEVERLVDGSVDIRRCYGNALMRSGHALSERVYKGRDLRERIAVDLDLQEDLLNNGFQMIHTPNRSGKNRADILIALDCMEFATRYMEIDTFAILSHDSDFSPLIHRLRALGKQVVWITVGDPSASQFRGKRSLESMATHRVIYDQKLVNAAGRDILLELLTRLHNESKSSLESGIALSTLHSQMLQKHPDFSYENVGFPKFKEFVDACIDDPFVMERNTVLLTNNASEIVQEGKEAISASDREQELTAALNRQNIRPLPEIRSQITEWLFSNVFRDDEKPKDPGLTYGKLQDLVEDCFHEKRKMSKSKIRDVIKLLSMSGLLIVDRQEALPLKISSISKLLLEEKHPSQIAPLIIQRLQNAGVTISEKDFPAVAQVVFGSHKSDDITVIQEAFDIIANTDEE
ncbi:MAG: NYN domain-containing protein [Anaerolineae bacterium]|nr:NYN domain-containing protein [Anaerolineae bacterium]